jgi:hypothetical protein
MANGSGAVQIAAVLTTAYTDPVVVSALTFHRTAPRIRTPPLSSAEADRDGRIYVVWKDCRFEADCAANDLLLSTSDDGASWSQVRQIPLDPIGSNVERAERSPHEILGPMRLGWLSQTTAQGRAVGDYISAGVRRRLRAGRGRPPRRDLRRPRADPRRSPRGGGRRDDERRRGRGHAMNGRTPSPDARLVNVCQGSRSRGRSGRWRAEGSVR